MFKSRLLWFAILFSMLLLAFLIWPRFNDDFAQEEIRSTSSLEDLPEGDF